MSPSPNRTASRRPAKPRTGGSQVRGAASARARLAAEQARQERRRRQRMLVIIPLAVVLVAVAALVVVRLTGLGSSKPTVTGPADSGVIPRVTSVPAGVLDQVGAGAGTKPPKSISGAALTADGKPRVLYVGAEYCPYCAAERWSMVVALSRFGSFSGLGQTASDPKDVYPSTPTLTFHGSSFTSSTISFTGAEIESNERQGGGHAPLDTLSAADQELFSTLGGGSFPFVDIGGKYVITGSSYDPQLLAGKTHAQIAAALSDPSSNIAKAVDGTANIITAAICASTDNKPANVCTSAGVQAAAKTLS